MTRTTPIRATFLFRMVSLMLCLVWVAAPLAEAQEVELAFESPWLDTRGGTLPANADEPEDPYDPWTMAPWEMTALRNDTEQAFITLTNTADSPVEVTVSVVSDMPEDAGRVELLATGSIASRHHGTPLINLFTAEQLATFEGDFPETFGNTQVIRDFPTLHLPPDEPVRVWLRVQTMDPDADPVDYAYTPAGEYTITFRGEGEGIDLSQEIDLKVIPTQMPQKPLIEAGAYTGGRFARRGEASERHARQYHVTIQDGHKRYTHTYLGRPGSLELAEEDPVAFQRRVNEAVDRNIKQQRELGYEESQILLNMGDEPSDHSVDYQVAAARAVKRYRPDIKIYANPGAYWIEGGGPRTLEGVFQKLDPYVDVWAPHSTHYQNEAVASFLKETDAELWYYNNLSLQTARNESQVLDSYRKLGWIAIRHDLDGMQFWAAKRYMGDPWDDMDEGHRDWPDAAVVFESDAGPISTRGWEAWRETVEDVNIYRMIERVVEAEILDDDLQKRARSWLRVSPMKVIGTDAGPRYGDWRAVYQTKLRAYNLLEAIAEHREAETLIERPREHW